MPIYEYQCNACGHKVEALQKISEDPLKICPECQQSELQKLVSSTSFQLKGSGWYATDFKTKPDSAPKNADATPKNETKSTETKTETTGTASSKSDTSDSTGK